MCGLADSNRADIKLEGAFCKTNQIFKILKQTNTKIFLPPPELPSKEYFGDMYHLIHISEVIYLFYAVMLAFESQSKCPTEEFLNHINRQASVKKKSVITFYIYYKNRNVSHKFIMCSYITTMSV